MSWVTARQVPTVTLLCVLACFVPLMAANSFWLGSFTLFAIYALFSLSVSIAYSQGGILSMATGAFGSLGAYCTAIVTTHLQWSPYIALLLSLLIPMALAYPLARLVTRLSALPLSIATLVLGSIVALIIRESGALTGGYIGISGIPSASIANGPVKIAVVAWVAVAAVVFMYCNLRDSAFGRAARTARHDPLRAIADGANVPHVLAQLFMLSAGVAGLGGWLYAQYLSYVSPESLSTVTSIEVLLMGIIGGVGTVLGPIIGTCFLLLVVTYLPASGDEGMVFGGTIVLFLLFAPRGVLGWIKGEQIVRWFFDARLLRVLAQRNAARGIGE